MILAIQGEQLPPRFQPKRTSTAIASHFFIVIGFDSRLTARQREDTANNRVSRLVISSSANGHVYSTPLAIVLITSAAAMSDCFVRRA